ncbi:Ig-like domain-containing protein [Pseudomonas sp. NY15181]|uniref:Ig-like domain-containing protein n=1 Tax=Pseudomonas sp. NY15181 TaxID=3400349 RepID=UPI003A8A2A19
MWRKKTARGQSAHQPARSALALALEARMMFDGAVAATVGEAADTKAPVDAPDAKPTADASATHDNLAAAPAGTSDSRHDVVFVDGQVNNYQQLLVNLKPGTEVVVLDPKGDGLKQIADYLGGRTGIDAIHVVSHGLPGQVTLGSVTLDRSTLEARAADLGSIGRSLDANGDILFYGCDVGSGAAGQAFIDRIAQLTGADVAASNDATGAASRGGDWALEVSSGAIEATVPFSKTAQEAFSGRLFSGTVDFSGADNANLGNTVTDGMQGSVDVPGVTLQIYSATTGNINNMATWEYGSDLSFDGSATPNDDGIYGDGNNGSPIIVIRSQGGQDFSFTGLKIVDALAVHSQLTFTAFRDGNSLGSVTINRDSQVVQFINQSNGLTPAIFRNVDEVRITPVGNEGDIGQGARLWVGLDAIQVADPVVPPTLVSATFSDNALKVGDTSTVTFTFSTAVTGFDASDVTAPNGTLGNFTSVGDGSTWTALFTPNANASSTSSVLTVNLAGVTGAAGAGSGTANSSPYSVDTLLPTISSVTSSTANGVYKAGDVISIQVNFSETVNVTGTPQLTLETGSTDRVVNYASGSGTSTLTFNYTVQAGDTSADLDYISSSALSLNGGSIRDNATNDANLSLSAPGAAGSLGANKGIVINSAPSLGNLNGDSLAWAGVGNTVGLDVGGNATASDTEFGSLNGGLGDWSGASLSVQRQGTAVTSDQLGFNTSGASFTISAGNLQAGGLTFATYTNTGGVLTITFNSSGTAATTALVQNVLQHISYRNDTPAGDANMRIALSDGTTTATANVTVTSDTIYVTNTTDTATINVNDGVSFSEAVAIAAADATGTQTLVFTSNFNTTVALAGNLSISESLNLNADAASGLVISGSTITLGGGTTLNFSNASGTVGIASTLGGSGSLNKAGGGTLVLSSVSNEASMSGGMTVSGGNLQVSGDDYLSSGTLTLDGGTLTNNATGFTIDNAIVLGSGGGTINVGGGAGATSLVLSGVISGTGTLTKNGQAILELSGNNTYSGLTDVQSGTLILSHANALGTTAGATSVASGATVRIAGILTVAESFTIAGTGKTVSSINYGALHLISGSSTLSGTITFAGDADISAASGSTLTLSGALGGSSNLNKTDAGTLVLSNTANEAGMSGGMTVSAGTLSIGADDNLSIGTLTLAGGTLATTSAVTIDNAVAVTSASTISTGSNTTFSGVLSGSGTLTKAGANTLTLSGINTHIGAVNLTAGGLTLSGGSAIGDGSAVTLSAGTTLTLASAETIGSLAGSGSVVLNAQLTTGGDNTSTTYAGVMSGASGLTKAGSGTMTLTGNNLFTGAASVSSGGLTLNRVGGALSDSASVTVASGATLTISADEAIDSLFGAGTVALGGQSLMVGVNGASSNFSGSITGSGALVQDGTGTLTLSGANGSQGWAVRAYDGTLAIANAGNIGTGAIELNSGTLSISDDTTLANTFTLSGAGGTLSVAAGKAVGLTASNTGTGGLTKAGSGTLTLSGSNNYLGTTTVSAGTLSVTGSTASATTVASGATLAGSGILGGGVTVQGGGTLSPGITGVNNGVGTLTINGNLQMNAGSTLAVEIDGTTAGTGYDQVLVNGTVNVSGATLVATHGYVPASGDSYNIIVNDASDAVTGAFSGLTEGSVLTAGGNSTELTVSYIGGTGNDITLTAPINAAPVLGNLGGDSVTYTQGNGSILLDGTSDATVTDSDSPDFNGGSLNVSIVANGVSAEDVLGILNQGTGAGQIGVSGANVTFGGTVIGSVSGGTGGSALVVTFNANATAAAVQALVRNLTYDNINASNGIGQAARTVRVTVNDGDSATTSQADVTVSVVETVPPTATIVVTDTSLIAGESSTVTITFSEAVTGLDLGDFTVANGTLSNLSTSDNITWTATLTPSASFQGGSNHISLSNTGYTDQAGNAGVGTTDSNNYAIDTLRPTASIVVADTALKAGETTTVTITFNRAVTGLDVGDFTVANGALSNLSTADNVVWTATLTPAASTEDSSNVITLDNGGVIDGAGNTGTGSTNSGNYAVDTLRPTATIVVGDTSLAVGETSTVTITFSETVTGLTTADFTVAHGTLSNLSSSDGGITWTATLTPTAGIVSTANLISLNNSGFTDAAGNTGSGSTDSNNYVIDTEAPINAVPAAQTTNTVTPLVFSSANGNALTVSDGGQLTVVVSVAGGALNATTGGTAIITGNGTGSVTLSGTAAEVNAALEGLTYIPDGAGSRSISLQSTDSVGNSDTDLVAVTVNNSTLVVTSDLDTGADQSTAASFAADQADGNGLSIREALFWARGGDTITFDLNGALAGNQGGTIVLNGTQLDIHYSNLNIDGDLNDDGVADVTLSGNHASRVMAVGSSVTGVEITGLTLTQGVTGGGGGGLYIGAGSSLTLRDSVISNNTDIGGGGGGLYATASTVTVINSTISGNTSNTFGGGIRVVSNNGALNLINSTVSGNTTTGTGAHGGGLQFGGTNPLVIINSTFSGNAALGASSFGGGIRVTSGTAFFYNVTVVGNASTSTGGGINASGIETFVNTVVAGNTSGAGATAAVGGSPLATGGAADDVGNTVETATNSFFGSNVSITTATGVLNNQGTAGLLLGNLANNGGTVLTHKPQAGSALLKAGSKAALPTDTFDLDKDGNTSEALPIDANGKARSAGTTVDIGAVEANAAPVLSNLGGGGSYTEGGAAIVIDSDASVADADLDALNGGAGDYSGASLVVVRHTGADASDLFGFQAGNGITRVGNTLVKNGQVIASFDTSVTGQLTLTFTNANGQTPTRADVNHILQQLTYANASDDPVASVGLDWTFADDQGATSVGTALVSLVAVNDAPLVNATGGSVTLTENGSAVDLFSGVSIDTVEAGQSITGLTFTVSGLADGASEILRIDGTDIALVNGANGLTSTTGIAYSVSVVGGTATVTLTHAGLSTAAASSVIDGMSYRNSSEAPASGTRSVTLVGVRDSGGTASGGVDSTSAAIAANVSVVAVNDAPVISAPGSIPVVEDTPQPLGGISFTDVDAGSGSVTAHFSVASGALTASSGAGVTVSGSGTGSLTLVGSVADINAFIAANGLSFTPAANANGNVTLSIGIDDGGNTGSGGALTDSTSVTLAVSAVNDAPVNGVPGAQSLDQDGSLVFSVGNGNLISIGDVDAGSGELQVTLTASHGVLTLGSLTGLTFISGDGNADASLVFRGSLADINAALNGLTFTPTGGYNGPAGLQISTSDLGNSGSGGALVDTDAIAITVDPLNPVVTHIGVSNPNGSYHLGDVITVTVTFDQVVIVDAGSGVPTLLLETGLIDRSAIYLSGSGSNTLTFRYTVQAGDLSADLNQQSSGALALNGGSIRNAGNRDAILTLPAAVGADSIAAQHDIAVDGVAPTVTSVSVPANGTYVAGQNLDFTVNLSEAVTVDTSTGAPRLAITLDGGRTVFAQYLSGSGSSVLVFRYTVQPGDNDADGIQVTGLSANGGRLSDAVGNDMNPSLNNVGDSHAVLVDTRAPSVTSVVRLDPSPTNAKTVDFLVSFDENVSGVDSADFTVVTSAIAKGSVRSVTQVDARTWRVSVGDIRGVGNLGLRVNAGGIIDGVGNVLAQAFNGESYAIGALSDGDPQFRVTTPTPPALPTPTPLQPSVPVIVAPPPLSPLLPPSLFTPPSLGEVPTLGNIFIRNGEPAQSFLAQVFGDASFGDGSARGFLGFGGGDAGVFGSSTLSGIFNRDGFDDSTPLRVFERRSGDIDQGLRGIFGAPTLAQQLHEIHETEQQPMRDLAWALGQIAQDREAS